MISRRNIRVKVMQTLYSLETCGQSGSPGESVKILEKHLTQSRQLFIYLIHFIVELAQYAEIESRRRSGKHLPTFADKNINIKLAGNEIIQKILEEPTYVKALKADKPQLLGNTDLVKRLFQELVETQEYKKYVSIPERDKKSEKEILDFIFTDLILPNELFEAYIEEVFTNWDDDAGMMVQLLPGFFNKPQSYDLLEMVSKEKWDFAKNLLLTVQVKKEVTMDLIKPKLKNWEADRIAAIDMILMRMGVCEFLYFETIPPKVTINEYIDVAKDYSTQQSGQFVNGILDNIHKDLLRENKLHKVSYK
ncbi:MAG TPA: transcription antitermination factor NusB [Puia sp.]|nr:transcription antitermination factor NusB [Puia sp.]